MGSVIVRSESGLRQEVTAGRHHLVADEPQAGGRHGFGTGPVRAPAGRARGLHGDDAAPVRRAQEMAAGGDPSSSCPIPAVYAEDCAGCERPGTQVERITRNDRPVGPARCRAGRPPDRDRAPLPGAQDAHRGRSGERRGLDPAAAQADVAVVEHRRLPRGDRALRLVEPHVGAAAGPRRHRRRGGRVAVADLDQAADRRPPARRSESQFTAPTRKRSRPRSSSSPTTTVCVAGITAST